MIPDSNRDTPIVPLTGSEHDGFLRACRFLRNLVRVDVAVLALVVAWTFCILVYMLASENFPPKTEHVMATESWKPFLSHSSHFSDALQNMDDGSIAMILYPPEGDWNAFLNNVAAAAPSVGWVRSPDTEGQWAKRPYHIRGHARKLVRRYSDTGAAVHAYFERQAHLDEPFWIEGEVVELTHLEKSGTVMFVSFYRSVGSLFQDGR